MTDGKEQLLRLTYRLDEAARLSGVSVRTIDRMIRSGALPAVRCGRRVLVHYDDLMTWLGRLPKVPVTQPPLPDPPQGRPRKYPRPAQDRAA